MGPATTYFMLLHIWSSISYWEKSIARHGRHLKCISFYVYESHTEQQTCFVRDLKRKARSLIISVQFPNSKQRPCELWIVEPVFALSVPVISMCETEFG